MNPGNKKHFFIIVQSLHVENFQLAFSGNRLSLPEFILNIAHPVNQT